MAPSYSRKVLEFPLPRLIWQLPNTSDCSGTGGDGRNFESLCYNQNEVNAAIRWVHDNDPAIRIDVSKNHTYSFIEETPFIGTGGNFIANFLTDGEGYDYGLGNDWICPASNCSHGGWTKTFTAKSDYLYFSQASACLNSVDCFTTNLRIFDLSNPDDVSPSAKPIPNPPVSKVFFIPGFGSSWNPTAFSACTLDPNPSNWSLAPYAQGVYYNILNTLSKSNRDTTQFYYDWRAEVDSNAHSLEQKINEMTLSNEKIDIVGHSMGGLVARDYLENTNGEKINKILTVGTPHGGVVQSYAAWAGGDIWEDNFLEKIAMTLYLKHCGGIFSNNKTAIHTQVQSIQNLLPTFPYLQRLKSSMLYLPDSQINNNNWLPTNFTYPPKNIDMETLSGFGYMTLQSIQTKEATGKDLRVENWIDGKPSGKIYSMEGDGTVLSISSQVSGVKNVSIKQNHSGLVNSDEGISEILNFLEISSPMQTTPTAIKSTEKSSALIIIGYPSNFWISDEKSNIKKDIRGMISYIDPVEGSYQLDLIPQTGNTLFVVAQFLPNGQVKYKEYKFIGFGPVSKTIKFDPENPTEDILN